MIEKKICAICGKAIRPTQYATIRQQWVNQKGRWNVPRTAIVHVSCDRRESKKAKSAR